ncbi:valyl-tRNA synthetase [Pancytospora philotis]|nr:valyl-tRNA synthetase [Pancytospora philotis]
MRHTAPARRFVRAQKFALMADDKKEEKRQLKDAKRAEKLAKLQAKQEAAAQQSRPAAKKEARAAPSKGYDPAAVEKHWMEYWRANGCFAPVQGGAKRFSMVIPPPNITGSLHIGHAMMIAIEDAIVRHKRLTGHEVLYLPGLDHAGIATQNVVMKAHGPMGRAEFMDAAFAWAGKYGDRICEQFDRMGTSLDYSRKTFTLDPAISRAVNTAFVRLYERGLIYRDQKIVNWCGKLRTTLSDLEVNYKDVAGGTYMDVDGGSYKFGMMYYVKYYIGCEGIESEARPYVVVGTTRPETILGDTALCANPLDERFSDVDKIFADGCVPDVMNARNRQTSEAAGAAEPDMPRVDGLSINEEIKTERKNKYKMNKSEGGESVVTDRRLYAINPLTGKRIPIIFDTHADLAFGTGMLKVTPAHDPADFKLGKRHGLEFIQMMDDDNVVTVESPYKGMRRFEARKKVLADLGEQLVASEPHPQVLPVCSRSNDLIEPVVRDQWWLNCQGMAEKAIEGVRSGDIKVVPEEAKAVWYRWLENIREWCLSRQLWWGHRVPAYRAYKTGAADKVEWIVAETEEIARQRAAEKGLDCIEQDEDVLDTWFSSGLWPFTTMGWPDKTADLERYFPNSMLETGSDILFFWVARMVMLSYELCGCKPFDTILLHGIVRDSHGRKMSKSLGNVVDPVFVIDGITLDEMIDNLAKGNLDKREVKRAADALRRDFPNGIPKCGADALRFTLLSYFNGMRDINLDILRVQGYARLCNKIYNAYVFLNGRYGSIDLSRCDPAQFELLPHHRWIIQRLNECIEEQHATMEAYNFMAATQSVHSLFLYSFCDIALEASKAVQCEDEGSIMGYVFSSILKLFSPYMPFITEDLHFKLFGTRIVDYPTVCTADLENSFADVVALAKICRTATARVQRFSGCEYLSTLVKDGVELVGELEGETCQTVNDIKYLIVN